MTLPDVQSTPDTRQIDIDRVGVSNIRWPIKVRTIDQAWQDTVATIAMSVRLPRNEKGTHMSRFLQVLTEHANKIHLDSLRDVGIEMLERLDADEAHINLTFPYFREVFAPVTRERGLAEVDVEAECVVNREAPGHYTHDLLLTVRIPATSLCPCSKTISERGAHNQRSIISVSIRYDDIIWIEEMVSWCESAASCPVFPVLKRPDEKWVTETAYDNPKFVEDIVRDLAKLCLVEKNVRWFKVSSENQESIHAHNAYAEIERQK